MAASAIHELSGRAGATFIRVNCAAIPRDLVESELFGHEKGSFTGATAERDGVFVQADGGTLFLDELGELPMAQQPHLLRALETRRIKRVGGARERAVDIRLVAATNRLELDGAGSPLRADVFHRVATIVIELPPLRARRADIPILVDSFLAELAPEFGTRVVPGHVLAALAEHDWPGNVRELRHAVHRATALSGQELRIEDLLPRRSSFAALRPPMPGRASEPAPDDAINLVDAALRELFDRVYREQGSVRRAAKALGVPKSTFADKARKLGVLR